MEEKPWRESVAFGSRADSRYLADSKESCGFEYNLPILENLADYVSLADSRWGMMMIAGFRGLYIQKKVRATSRLIAKQGEVSRLKSVGRRMRKNALRVKAAWKSARGSCNLTPALHHRLSNQEEARVFSNRGEERERRRRTKGRAGLAL